MKRVFYSPPIDELFKELDPAEEWLDFEDMEPHEIPKALGGEGDMPIERMRVEYYVDDGGDPSAILIFNDDPRLSMKLYGKSWEEVRSQVSEIAERIRSIPRDEEIEGVRVKYYLDTMLRPGCAIHYELDGRERIIRLSAKTWDELKAKVRRTVDLIWAIPEGKVFEFS